MARKTGLLGTSYNTEAKPKKTRQGRGKHSKYSATSRNSARKRYRGQGKWNWKESISMVVVDKYLSICRKTSIITVTNTVVI